MKNYMNPKNFGKDEWKEFTEAIIAVVIFGPALALTFIFLTIFAE